MAKYHHTKEPGSKDKYPEHVRYRTTEEFLDECGDYLIEMQDPYPEVYNSGWPDNHCITVENLFNFIAEHIHGKRNEDL